VSIRGCLPPIREIRGSAFRVVRTTIPKSFLRLRKFYAASLSVHIDLTADFADYADLMGVEAESRAALRATADGADFADGEVVLPAIRVIREISGCFRRIFNHEWTRIFTNASVISGLSAVVRWFSVAASPRWAVDAHAGRV
jgi:hypothetical protein